MQPKCVFKTRFPEQVICSYDQNNPHLLMCTVKLQCGHMACLRCSLQMMADIYLDLEGWCIKDKKITQCLQCSKLDEMKFEELLKRQFNTIYMVSDNKVNVFTKNLLEALNESVIKTNKSKVTENRNILESYLNIIKHQEEDLHIRIISIKTKFDKIKKNLQKSHFKYFDKIKNSADDQLYCLYKLESLRNFIYSENIGKSISISKVGLLKVQPSVYLTDSLFYKNTSILEKMVYTNLSNDKFNGDYKQLSDFFQKITGAGSADKHVQELRLIKHFENLMNSSSSAKSLELKNEFKRLANRVFTDREGGDRYSLSQNESSGNESSDSDESVEQDSENSDNHSDNDDNDRHNNENENNLPVLSEKNENSNIKQLLSVLNKIKKIDTPDEFLQCIDELRVKPTDEGKILYNLSECQFLSAKITLNYKNDEFHFNYLKQLSKKTHPNSDLELKLSNLIKCFIFCKISTLLDNDIQINRYIDNYGANALHMASLFGRNDIILWLHFKRFSFYSIDVFGFTALAYAASDNQIDTIALLNILGLNDMYIGRKPFLRYYLSNSSNGLLHYMRLTALLKSNFGEGLNAIAPNEREAVCELIETITKKQRFI